MAAPPENRTQQGRFAKGKSGNPGGRPALIGEFRDKCRERTDAALKALEDALEDPLARVAAAKVLLEFGWGKPSQSMQVTGEEGRPLSIIINTRKVTG